MGTGYSSGDKSRPTERSILEYTSGNGIKENEAKARILAHKWNGYTITQEALLAYYTDECPSYDRILKNLQKLEVDGNEKGLKNLVLLINGSTQKRM